MKTELIPETFRVHKSEKNTRKKRKRRHNSDLFLQTF